jgi:hypothetical protein
MAGKTHEVDRRDKRESIGLRDEGLAWRFFVSGTTFASVSTGYSVKTRRMIRERFVGSRDP